MYCDLVLLQLISKRDWERLTWLVKASSKAMRRLRWMERRDYVHLSDNDKIIGEMSEKGEDYLRKLPGIIYRTGK